MYRKTLTAKANEGDAKLAFATWGKTRPSFFYVENVTRCDGSDFSAEFFTLQPGNLLVTRTFTRQNGNSASWSKIKVSWPFAVNPNDAQPPANGNEPWSVIGVTDLNNDGVKEFLLQLSQDDIITTMYTGDGTEVGRVGMYQGG